MEQITIIKKDGTNIKLFSKEPFTTVTSATQEKEMMSTDTIKIDVESANMLTFQIGDKIKIGEYEYLIRTANTREIAGEDCYKYSITFYGVMYELMKTLYRDCDADGNSTSAIFDLTYTLKEFINVVIYNLNRDYPGIWAFDSTNCPDTEAMTLSFSKQNCLQVLQTVCNKYSYEFVITQASGIRTIKIGKFGSVIKPPTNADYFEVGKGKGLYTLKEDKVDDKSIITRLWVEGGTTNIPSGYRNYSERLQLPLQRLNSKSHTLSDGTVIAAGSETIGIADEAHRYFEDADLKANIGSIEDIDQTDEICPKRTGKVTALGADIYTFVDDTMDFDLNEKNTDGSTKYLIADTTVKITFTSGKLAGQQFELKKDGGYAHATKTFSLIKYTDERGMSFPSEASDAFRFAVGDTYKITDIILPQSYIDDAEEELWYYGLQKFRNAKQARVQYTLSFTRDYFINNLPTDSNDVYFHVGDYIPIRDTRFGIEKNIRITKISRNLLLDQDYTLTISDTYSLNIISQIVNEVISHKTIIEQSGFKDLNRARRGWRTTEDLRNLVFDPDGYFDMDHMKANVIDTNMLTVGVKSQQFVLSGVVFQANYTGNPNQFVASAGTLYHLTIDDTTIKSWSMSEATVTLTDNGGYYVYAKCSKSGTSGVWYVTQQQLQVQPTSDANNYYFLVGIIGILHTDDNFRDFITTYGFTRINGRVVTTGRIQSADKSCFFDLDNNTIGGVIQFASGSTGYGNLADKPDISGMLQIWYQSTDPSSSWTDTQKAANVGYQWYDTTNKILYRYIVSGTTYSWSKIDDKTATDAAALAAAAKSKADTAASDASSAVNTANSAGDTAASALSAANKKGQVFTSTPTAPYNVGDLWITTVGNTSDATTSTQLIRICSVARTSGYYSSDWSVADVAGNLKTCIANGIYNGAGFMSFGGYSGIVGGAETSSDSEIRIWSGATYGNRASSNFKVYSSGNVESKGAIYVANSNGNVLAGMTGYGTSSSDVRMWAGNSYANRYSAPFRINQDGGGVFGGFTFTAGKSITATYSTDFGYGGATFGLYYYGVPRLEFLYTNMRAKLGIQVGDSYSSMQQIWDTSSRAKQLQTIAAQGHAQYNCAQKIIGSTVSSKFCPIYNDTPNYSWSFPISTSISSGIRFQDVFVFSPQSATTVYLPTFSDMSSAFSDTGAGYTQNNFVEITCFLASDSKNVTFSVSESTVYLFGANNGKSVTLIAGQSIKFAFWNKNWYIISDKTSSSANGN